MNAKELIGKVASNKKLGTALVVVGAVAGAIGKGIQHVVEKAEAKEVIKQMVKDELAGK